MGGYNRNMIFMKFHENRLIIDGEIYEKHELLVYVLIYLNWAVGLLGIAHFITWVFYKISTVLFTLRWELQQQFPSYGE